MLKWQPHETDDKDKVVIELVDADDDTKECYGGVMTQGDIIAWVTDFPRNAIEKGIVETIEEGKMEVERRMMCYPLETDKPAIGRYNDAPHGFGEIISVRRFRKRVKDGDFTDNDGHGRPMFHKKLDSGCLVLASKLDAIPEDATHIQWYNK